MKRLTVNIWIGTLLLLIMSCGGSPNRPQLLGNVRVLHPVSGQQHDARALRQPHAGALGTRQLRQLDPGRT